MPTMLSLRRLAAAVAATLLLLTAACSSNDGPEAGSGAEGAPATPAREVPPPTVAAAVLDRPEVRAIEAWAASYARAVNRGDHAFGKAADPAAPGVREWMERHARSEWGRYFPGPLPVAPVEVLPVDATHREVRACVTLSGWSQESRASRRTRSTEVAGAAFRMELPAGRWRVQRIVSDAIDCAGATPRLRRW